MIETTVVDKGVGTSGEVKVEVNFFNSIRETMGDKFVSAMYDDTNKEIVFVVNDKVNGKNVSFKIDATAAKIIIDKLCGTHAAIIKASSSNKEVLLRAITTADMVENVVAGMIIRGSNNPYNWQLTYFHNSEEYALPANVTNWLQNTIIKRMSVTPEALKFEGVQFVDSLIPAPEVPELDSKIFVKSIATLLTVDDTDAKEHEDLTMPNGLVETPIEPLETATKDGVYKVNDAYYRVEGNGTKLTGITPMFHKVTAELPLEGVVAQEGKLYVDGTNVYSLVEGEIDTKAITVKSDGQYPELTANTYYKFTTSEVGDHPEIKLDVLYVCVRTEDGLVEVPSNSIEVVEEAPVVEIALEGEYYQENEGNVKQVVDGEYQDLGALITQEDIPDVTTPVLAEDTFYLVTSNNSLIYKPKSGMKTTLTAEEYTLTENMPAFYDENTTFPEHKILYVLNLPDGNKPAGSAWMYDDVEYIYEEVKY